MNKTFSPCVADKNRFYVDWSIDFALMDYVPYCRDSTKIASTTAKQWDIHIYIHIHTHIYIYIYVHIYIYIYIHTYIQTCIYTPTNKYIYTSTNKYPCWFKHNLSQLISWNVLVILNLFILSLFHNVVDHVWLLCTNVRDRSGSLYGSLMPP